MEVIRFALNNICYMIVIIITELCISKLFHHLCLSTSGTHGRRQHG